MGASRLQQAADILGVRAVLFRGGGRRHVEPDGSSLSPAYIDDFVTTSDGLRLMKAFMRIRPAMQRRIVALVNEVAGEANEMPHKFKIGAVVNHRPKDRVISAPAVRTLLLG